MIKNIIVRIVHKLVFRAPHRESDLVEEIFGVDLSVSENFRRSRVIQNRLWDEDCQTRLMERALISQQRRDRVKRLASEYCTNQNPTLR